MSDTYPWRVVIRPGCHARPTAPLISRHRTLEAAVRAARRSDRLAVQHVDHGIVWSCTSRQPTRHGYGRYGGRSTRSLREDLAAAAHAAAE